MMRPETIKKRRLFTLVELITVLVIIAVALSFVFNSIKSNSTVKLEAAANKVFLDMQYAQNLAISTSVWCGVEFAVDPANTYRLLKVDRGRQSAVENPANPGTDFVVHLYDFYRGVSIKEVNIAGGENVWFHPLGSPFDKVDGRPIIETGLVTLEYSGVTKTISVNPNTGRIEIL